MLELPLVLRVSRLLIYFIYTRMEKGVGDDSATATYVERSVAPLNPQGWTTFRRIGCFTRAEEREPQDQSHHRLQHLSMDKSEHVALKNADRTPEGCAAHCSVEAGGGVGFFGIGSGDE